MLRRLLLVLVPALAAPMAAHAAPFVFGYPVNVLWPGTDAVVVADFNGDGRDDLAAVRRHDYSETGWTSSVPATRRWLDGTGTFADGLVFGTVHVADLGADGTREILVGHDKGLGRLPMGWGGRLRFEDYPGEHACRNIATADLDGDGAPDALCLGADADAMLHYSNPVPSLPHLNTSDARHECRFAGTGQLKDVTGDGKPDLVLWFDRNQQLLRLSPRRRSCLPAGRGLHPMNTPASQSVEVFDLDHDGANEVVVTVPCNVPCANLHIYRQGPNGYLDRSQEFPDP